MVEEYIDALEKLRLVNEGSSSASKGPANGDERTASGPRSP
jgi:hypothetical protein